MLQITIDPAETRRALEKLRKSAEQIEGGIEEMLLREGAQMEQEIKLSLNVGGRIAGKGPRGGKLRQHSAPGEPPYKQSGRLQNSIGYFDELLNNWMFRPLAQDFIQLRTIIEKNIGALLCFDNISIRVKVDTLCLVSGIAKNR